MSFTSGSSPFLTPSGPDRVAMTRSYCIPLYCRMPANDHLDGMGGCWGISHGLVKKNGRDYCRECCFYRRNAERVEPFTAMGQIMDGVRYRNRGKFMAGVSDVDLLL